jgi:putative ABC transport system ATP-binding protein
VSAKVAPPDNEKLWARELHYAHDGSPALLGVSLSVREGEILSITGPRGCGKSTLLGCLSGLLLPRQGEVWFNSIPVHTLSPTAREQLRRDCFGWVGSHPELVPELTGWENAALPLLLNGVGSRAAKRTAEEWLERLDVGDCARQRPAALPQSKRQRIAIARALVHEPQLLFADEPDASLHRAEGAHALRILTTAARSHHITVLITTHDRAVSALSDRAISLVDGRQAATPTASEPGSEDRAACSLSV